MFTVIETVLSGCLEVRPKVARDSRGLFAKVFHERAFKDLKMPTHFQECFWSSSSRGVLRGMHFQVPPADHAKLVFCPHGSILDAVVDLRLDSPTFGQHTLCELSGDNGTAMFVPRGMAHGFLSTSDHAIVGYLVETMHDPVCDLGIHWDSCGIPWPETTPLISARDAAFPHLSSFISPFTCSPAHA